MRLFPWVFLLAAACGGATSSFGYRSSASMSDGIASSGSDSSTEMRTRESAAFAPDSAAESHEEMVAPVVYAQSLSSSHSTAAPEPPEAAATGSSAPPVVAAVEAVPPAAVVADTSDRALPIVIYNASVVLAVYRIDEAKRALRTLIEARGGYIAEEAERQVTLRVPASVLHATLEGFSALGDIQRRTLNSTDVTEEYSDLTIRIRNLQQVRLRLEAVLARATSIEDTIRVETELRRITEELERLEGRMRYLRDRVSLSTITVVFTDRSTDQPNRRVNLPFPWLDQIGLSHLLQN